MDIGPEGVRSETQIDTLFHSMIWETPSGQFITEVDFRRYASVKPTTALHFGCATVYSHMRLYPSRYKQ